MKNFAIACLVTLACSASAYAEHSWGNFHWARSSNPLQLTVINSTTAAWDPYVAVAIGDWNQSGVLNINEDQNGSTRSKDRRRCKAPTGQVRICNLAYGLNGWLGIAGISVDSGGHILSGYTKLNDSYFSLSYYNQDNWKQSVTCQELGHDVGLGHQDENFNNTALKSCMDYQDPPWETPNSHDYAELDAIYAHTDSGGGSVDDGGDGGCNAPRGRGCNRGEINGHNGDIGWGMSLGRRGQQETFMRIDPDGTRHITHVTWALGH